VAAPMIVQGYEKCKNYLHFSIFNVFVYMCHS